MPKHQTLLNRLMSQFPGGLDDAPPQLRKVIQTAVQQSEQGDDEMLRELIEVFDGIDTGALVDSSEPEMPLSDPQVAEAMLQARDEIEDADQLYAFLTDQIKASPNSVELHYIAGMYCDEIKQACRHFRDACDATRHHDTETVATVMPGYRVEMAQRLSDAMKLDDVCEVLLPVVNEDYESAPTAIVMLIEALLRLDRDQELSGVLQDIDPDPFPMVMYAQALLEYRRAGDTRRGRALLKAANALLPDVAIQWIDPSSVESEDEVTNLTAECLQYAMNITQGAVDWVHQTLADVFPDFAGPSNPDDSSDALTSDTPLSKRMLAELTDEAKRAAASKQSWRLLHGPVKDKRCNDAGIHYVAVLMNDSPDDEGSLRSCQVFQNKPKPALLREVLLRGIVDPVLGQSGRPAELIFSTKTDCNNLKAISGKLDIACVHEPHNVIAKYSIKGMLQQVATMMLDDFNQHGDALPGDATDDDANLSNLSLDDLRRQSSDLPLRGEDQQWLVGIFSPPLFIQHGSGSERGRTGIVINNDDGTIVGFDLSMTEASDHEAFGLLLQTMRQPKVGSPGRPASIVFAPSCAPPCIGENDDWMMVGDDRLEQLFTEMVGDMLLAQSPVSRPLVKIDGITHDQLADLYDAAADFYLAKPWHSVPGDTLITVYDDSTPGASNRVASVMGQMGQEFGINIFDDESAARALFESLDPTTIRGLAVNYGEARDCIPVDAWNLERYGWSLAAPQAYPLITQIAADSQGPRYQCPDSADELLYLTRVLRTLPAYLADQTPDPSVGLHYGRL
ncbi:DUF7309 domain-containing protein [Crateriforma spongiae]|uniref:DUF7309 domain-containing protein n=1 Tax=Crateriforma spongiae TaxID=2724528 RepID=UPI0014471773|nr:hypothetical protein [Crateriforma spongiae]